MPPEGDFGAGCVWADGAYLPVFDGRISIFDNGLLFGDLTYDVVAVWEGAFFRLDDHLDRFWQGCEKLHLEVPMSRSEVREILFEMVRRAGLRDAYVHFMVSRGHPPEGKERDPRELTQRFYGYAIPYAWILPQEQLESGLDVVIPWEVTRIPPTAIDPTIKNFQWGDFNRGQREAWDRGGSCCLLTDGQGLVTEGAGYNVFALLDGKLHTPAEWVLLGITRRTVLEIAEELGVPTEVGPLPVELIKRAEEIFVTSTAGGVMAVRTLDGEPVGQGREGETTRRLRDRYWELHQDPRYVEPVDYDRSAAARPS